MKNQAATTKRPGPKPLRGQVARAGSKPQTEIPADAAHQPLIPVDPSTLQQHIRTEAYLRSERRGFSPGEELRDWFEAEYIVMRKLASRYFPF